MLNKLLTAALLIILVVSVAWMVDKKDAVETMENTEKISNEILVTLHKDQYCSCCGKWGSYMENNGYEINISIEDNMENIKTQLGVPNDLRSCHTAEIDGYVVEGHIPNEAIEKLLSERPDIKGIGMAGMPSGSPGMPGPKEDFFIYKINHDGTKGDLFIKL